MEDGVNKGTIRTLALANGLLLPDARLERVLKQYQNYLQLLARLDSFELKMDAEPATVFRLVPDEPQPTRPRQGRGEPHGNR